VEGGFTSSPPTSPGGSLRKRGRPRLTVLTDPRALEGGGGGKEGGREGGEGVKAKMATTPGRKRAASREMRMIYKKKCGFMLIGLEGKGEGERY